jgi:hypothetical protein
MRQDERRDAPFQFFALEVIVACNENGRFWAAVVRTGYLPAGARREIARSIDCASSNEALEKMYIVSQNAIELFYPASA